MLTNTFGNAAGAQSVFQPGFAGTDVQQVRNQINRDLSWNYGTGVQSGYGAGGQMGYGYQGVVGVPASIPAVGAQAVFQPGFAGTDAQQVRQSIAREGGFNTGLQSGYGMGGYQGSYQGSVGIPGAVSGGVGAQAVFQPGFAGTDVQQVRNQFSRDLSNYGTGLQPNYGTGLQPGFIPTGYQGAQAVFQPGFAGTDVQQVRNQIGRDMGMNYGAGLQSGFGASLQSNYGVGYQGTVGMPASIPATGPQAVFQPGFAGTDAQQVRQSIAREGGFSTGLQSGYAFGGQTPYPGGFGAQGYQQGWQ